MRQIFSDFSRDKWAFPVGSKCGVRFGYRSGFIIEHGHADLLPEGWVGLLNRLLEPVGQLPQSQLCPEDELLLAGRPVPEQDIELVIDEPCQGPLAGLADELSEFGFGRRNF